MKPFTSEGLRLIAYHMDKTEVSSSGFGKRPESKIISSNDHHSRLQRSNMYETNMSENLRANKNIT